MRKGKGVRVVGGCWMVDLLCLLSSSGAAVVFDLMTLKEVVVIDR